MGFVQFKQEEVDAGSGLLHHTVVDLYSTITEENIYNLLHMHIQDTSDTVRIHRINLC